MKRSVIIVMFLLVLFVSPLAHAQTYSGFNRLTDNIKLFFSSGDNKAKLALEIREKEINSAIENANLGNVNEAIKNINSASNKLEIVREKTSPDIAEEIKSNIEQFQNKITENDQSNEEIAQYLDIYLTEEQKTGLLVDLSEKTFSYCNELAMQDYELMLKDEKCTAYSWMENKIKQKLNEEQKKSQNETKNQIQICMNDPKGCSCDEISLLSEKKKCEEYKSLAIKCEFQNDGSACDKINNFKLNETGRDNYEKQILEQYVPGECLDAGIRDGEECKKLIISLNQPKTECMENGEYIGDEKCKEKLINDGNVVQDCVVNGELVDSSECLNIVKEKSKPTGEEFTLMSGECKERGVYDPVACDEIVNLPRPCKDAGYYTKKECEEFTLKQNLPQECIDAGALTPEACEKLKLPQKCQGQAFSNAECDAVFIKEKMPPECQTSGTYDFHKCAKLLYAKVSDTSIGGEIPYLGSKGISVGEIPNECFNDSSRTNFERDMDCDEALIKKFGIMLPPPAHNPDIPQQCIRDGTPVSPEECDEILGNGIISNDLQNVIPEICQQENVSTPDECGKLLEEKRQEQGIGINMPEECIGISAEDCKTLMEEKNITINKPEVNQDQYHGICDKGEENCSTEGIIKEGVPDECAKLGAYDKESCGLIMSKINEERIKQGDEITVDEKGNVNYISNEEINNLAEKAEKQSQDLKPDLEKAEGIKQEINNLEQNINEINEENNNLEQNINQNNKNGIKNEVNPGDSSGGNNVNEVVGGESSAGSPTENSQSSAGSSGPSGSSNDNSGGEISGSSKSGGGENSGGDTGVTGEVIGSGNTESFLVKIFKSIFGI
ncbi:MAG: hypothetical protein ABIE36_03210 [Candidatus Diapherotrites archaeon]